MQVEAVFPKDHSSSTVFFIFFIFSFQLWVLFFPFFLVTINIFPFSHVLPCPPSHVVAMSNYIKYFKNYLACRGMCGMYRTIPRHNSGSYRYQTRMQLGSRGFNATYSPKPHGIKARLPKSFKVCITFKTTIDHSAMVNHLLYST